MRRAVVLASSALLVGVLTLAVPTAALAVDHAGDVSGTWRAADSPHRVTGIARIPSGASLEVEAGCVVLFADSARLQADGTLLVRGTSGSPVTMASEEPGLPGSWKGLQLVGAGPHEFAFLNLAHATTGIAIGAGATLSLMDGKVSACAGDAVAFSPGSSGSLLRCVLADNGGGGVSLRDASPSLVSCRFDRNGRAAFVSGASFPYVADLRALGNAAGDGLLLDTLQPVRGEGVWTNGGLPWIVSGGMLRVANDGTVTLGPGCVVKLGGGARIAVEGFLATEGSAVAPCRLTSLRDDDVDAGGDTNGDGSLSLPAKGDWNAVEVAPGGVLRLRGTVIRLAEDGVRATGGETILYDCDVQEIFARGAAFGPLAEGVVLGTSFRDCDVGLQVATASQVWAGRSVTAPGAGGSNAFSCNGWLDVENLDAAVLEVHRSWFGEAGPDPARLSGPIDLGTPALSEPGSLDRRRIVTVSAAPGAAGGLALAWPGAGSCASFRVGVSERPDGPFEVLGFTGGGSFDAAPGSLPASALLFLDVRLQ